MTCSASCWIAVCYSVLQYVAVCCSELNTHPYIHIYTYTYRYVRGNDVFLLVLDALVYLNVIVSLAITFRKLVCVP